MIFEKYPDDCEIIFAVKTSSRTAKAALDFSNTQVLKQENAKNV